jgi:hypothetical protein
MKTLATAMLAQPPITQLIALKASESSESGWWISDMRPIDENPSARMNRLTPAEIFWKSWDVFIVGIGWFLRFGIWPFIGRLTVRYLVQMIFGTPVSGFEKKSEEIIWKKVLAVQQYAEFGLAESCGGGENGLSGKERDDICLVRVDAPA